MSVVENIPAGEQELIDALVVDLLAKQEKDYQAGTTARRDVHSKSNGLFRGQFRVHNDLPDAVRVGLFAQPRVYDCAVRLSNGAFGPTGFDVLPNIRGFAIKLYGVDGEKGLLGEEHGTEHDMLLANDSTFFTRTMEQMALLMRGQMKVLAKQHPSVIGMMLKAMFKVVKNPLRTFYYSQVPYRFGDGAAKYAVAPEKWGSFFSIPNIFDRHFLRHGAEKLLRRGPQYFTFYVQLQRPGDSLEDSSVQWHGRYYPVATLKLSTVTEPVLESDGEALSFHPWRARTEHTPLGWPGRLRRAIYSADFKWRTNKNARG